MKDPFLILKGNPLRPESLVWDEGERAAGGTQRQCLGPAESCRSLGPCHHSREAGQEGLCGAAAHCLASPGQATIIPEFPACGWRGWPRGVPTLQVGPWIPGEVDVSRRRAWLPSSPSIPSPLKAYLIPPRSLETVTSASERAHIWGAPTQCLVCSGLERGAHSLLT